MLTVPEYDLREDHGSDLPAPPGIVAINMKGEIIKFLGDNIGEHLCD